MSARRRGERGDLLDCWTKPDRRGDSAYEKSSEVTPLHCTAASNSRPPLPLSLVAGHTLTEDVLLVLSLSACQTTVKRSDSIAERAIAAWNSHDPDKTVTAYTDDVVYEDVPHRIISHGRAELREFVAGCFASDGDVKVELVNSWVHDGHGVMEWVWRGVDIEQFKTGKPFTIRGLSIFEVRDGKIWRNRDYYDVATQMRDVGALPK